MKNILVSTNDHMIFIHKRYTFYDLWDKHTHTHTHKTYKICKYLKLMILQVLMENTVYVIYNLAWQQNINSLLQGSVNNKITSVVIKLKILNILKWDVIKSNYVQSTILTSYEASHCTINCTYELSV